MAAARQACKRFQLLLRPDRMLRRVALFHPHFFLPPIIVYKRQQVLITLQSNYFSFVEGKPTTFVYDILRELDVRPNLTQNTAISLMLCIDDIPEKTEKISIAASEFFDVQIQKELT